MDITTDLYLQRELLIRQLANVEVRIAQNCAPVLEGMVSAETAAELNVEQVAEDLLTAIEQGFEVL